MKHIGIQTPCSEDRGNMTPNEKGSFCHKCAKQVHDFTNKSTGEIKQIFRDMMGQEICGRMTPDQELALNAEFEAWKFQSKRGFQRAMVFSLVVVFGLTLFSCSNEQDKQQIKHIQAVAMKAMNTSIGETPKDSYNLQQQTVPQVQHRLMKMVYHENLVYEPIHLEKEETPLHEKIEPRHQIDGGIGYTEVYREYLTATVTESALERFEIERVVAIEFAATAYPNPTADFTTFELNVPDKTRFDVGLYDMNGKLIQKVCDGKINRGTYKQDLDLTNLNPGIYLLIISSEDYKETIRISKI